MEMSDDTDDTVTGSRRFIRLRDVAEELAISLPMVRDMVRTGELPAVRIGGRASWRSNARSSRGSLPACMPMRATSSTPTPSASPGPATARAPLAGADDRTRPAEIG